MTYFQFLIQDKKKEENKEDNDDKKDSDGKSEQKETPGKGLNKLNNHQLLNLRIDS